MSFALINVILGINIIRVSLVVLLVELLVEAGDSEVYVPNRCLCCCNAAALLVFLYFLTMHESN